MIEMRYLMKDTGEKEMDEFGVFQPIEVKVLRYRYKELEFDRLSFSLYETEWSEWIDVPTVVEEE